MRLTRLFVINILPVSETQEANRRQVTSDVTLKPLNTQAACSTVQATTAVSS